MDNIIPLTKISNIFSPSLWQLEALSNHGPMDDPGLSINQNLIVVIASYVIQKFNSNWLQSQTMKVLCGAFKSKSRNRMTISTLQSLTMIKSTLIHFEKCCHDFDFHDSFLNLFNSTIYPQNEWKIFLLFKLVNLPHIV